MQGLEQAYRKKIDSIMADFRSHIVADDRSARTMCIDWSRYIPDYSDQKLEALVLSNPLKMQMFYRRVILLERERRGYEAFALEMIKIHNQTAYRQLQNFLEVIQGIQGVDPFVFHRFMELYRKLVDEITIHQDRMARNFTSLPYPTIIHHFTTLAQKISSQQPIELEQFNKTLNQELQSKRPVSKTLKAVMYGVLGAIIGGAIGLILGAALTFWGFGFGSLAGSIAGGIAGWSMGTTLGIGGAAVGVGLIAGASVSSGVFWNAKKKQANYDQAHQRVSASMQGISQALTH